jgi:hypothetical protein
MHPAFVTKRLPQAGGGEMTKVATINPRVTFALDYSTSWSTLNAGAAIARCDALLEDVLLAQKSMAAFAKSDEWSPPFGLEIFSYYIVGLTTCLEWHARSRLIDLFNHLPGCVLAEDLKGHINDRVLSQVVAAKVGIPEMLGAFLSVGSARLYFSTILRVFKELKIPKSEDELVAELQQEFDDPRETLQNLFEERHRLVHEIGLGQLGSWVLRSNIDLIEAERIGRFVMALLKLVEREITRYAPKGFPNKLRLDGTQENISEFLDQEIARLEAAIKSALQAEPDMFGMAATPELWQARSEAAATSTMADIEFLEACNFAGQRHIDIRGPIIIASKKARLQFLEKVAENLPPPIV